MYNILYYFLVMNAPFVTLPALLLASGVGAACYAVGRRRRLDDETEALIAKLRGRLRDAGEVDSYDRLMASIRRAGGAQ